MSKTRIIWVRNGVRNISITLPIMLILAITLKNRLLVLDVFNCVIFWECNTTQLMTAFFTDALANQQQQQQQIHTEYHILYHKIQ